jgi:hypothetical protein
MKDEHIKVIMKIYLLGYSLEKEKLVTTIDGNKALEQLLVNGFVGIEKGLDKKNYLYIISSKCSTIINTYEQFVKCITEAPTLK